MFSEEPLTPPHTPSEEDRLRLRGGLTLLEPPASISETGVNPEFLGVAGGVAPIRWARNLLLLGSQRPSILHPTLFQVHWTLPPPTLRGEPSPWLHRSVSKPMALPSPGPLVIAGLLLPNTNLLCSAPVHSISPFLPSGETTSSFTLRLLFSQASVLPNRLPGTLPSTGLRDLPALPSAWQRDLLHGVQPALLPGLLLLPQAGLGA